MITALARVARHVAPPVLDALIEWRAPKQREADVEIAKLRRYAPNADAVGPRARGVTHALACVQAPASADTPARQRRRAGGRRLISMDQTFGKITVKEAVAILTERRAVGARSPQPAVRVPRSASSSPTQARAMRRSLWTCQLTSDMLFCRTTAELVRNVKSEPADNTSFLRVEELAFEQIRLGDPCVASRLCFLVSRGAPTRGPPRPPCGVVLMPMERLPTIRGTTPSCAQRKRHEIAKSCAHTRSLCRDAGRPVVRSVQQEQ